MKESGSVRWVSAFSAAYLAAHLLLLPPSLEDIDSVNFALGLRQFDVGSHQPHPPGYPVYIAISRLALAAISALSPEIERVRAEGMALAVWSALGGAAALWAAGTFFRALDATRAIALWATALLAVSPLFWLSGSRPMSDLAGAGAALVAQALAVKGADDRRWLVAAAFVAGLAAGIRVQTMLLTLPLLGLAIARLRRQLTTAWIVSRPMAALVAAILLWAVPLLALSGGVGRYLAALGAQAGEDFAWVDMVWVNPTPRQVALSLYETSVLPWGSVPLGVLVCSIALLGGSVVCLRNRHALVMLLVAFAPYAVFHLLLQETYTVRYALPVLPATAWLAIRGAMTAGRLGAALALGLTGAAAASSFPAGLAYAGDAHPAFRALADMGEAVEKSPAARVYSHYALRRALQAASPPGIHVVEPGLRREWLALVDYWRDGGTAPVWFLADPRRTDLALIDPAASRAVAYRWAVADRPELTGTRPLGADWHTFSPPGWFATEGWALTPETGGVAEASGAGPHRAPIEAFVRRRAGPVHALVGGGFAGGPAGRPVSIDLAIDDGLVESWTLDPAEPRFLRYVQLPNGVPAGAGDYARLTIAARAPSMNSIPAVAIRQFDLQPAGKLIYGFGEGWHDEEYDNRTGRRWRWASDRAVMRFAPPQSVRLTIRGESPLEYFDDPPLVTITANGHAIAIARPEDDFTWAVTVPAAEVEAAGGVIVLETDRVYVPADRGESADRRRLGLRIFEIEVHPVLP